MSVGEWGKWELHILPREGCTLSHRVGVGVKSKHGDGQGKPEWLQGKGHPRFTSLREVPLARERGSCEPSVPPPWKKKNIPKNVDFHLQVRFSAVRQEGTPVETGNESRRRGRLQEDAEIGDSAVTNTSLSEMSAVLTLYLKYPSSSFSHLKPYKTSQCKWIHVAQSSCLSLKTTAELIICCHSKELQFTQKSLYLDLNKFKYTNIKEVDINSKGII